MFNSIFLNAILCACQKGTFFVNKIKLHLICAIYSMARGTGQNYICKIYIIAVSNIIQLFKFIKICYEYM